MSRTYRKYWMNFRRILIPDLDDLYGEVISVGFGRDTIAVNFRLKVKEGSKSSHLLWNYRKVPIALTQGHNFKFACRIEDAHEALCAKVKANVSFTKRLGRRPTKCTHKRIKERVKLEIDDMNWIPGWKEFLCMSDYGLGEM